MPIPLVVAGSCIEPRIDFAGPGLQEAAECPRHASVRNDQRNSAGLCCDGNVPLLLSSDGSLVGLLLHVCHGRWTKLQGSEGVLRKELDDLNQSFTAAVHNSQNLLKSAVAQSQSLERMSQVFGTPLPSQPAEVIVPDLPESAIETPPLVTSLPSPTSVEEDVAASAGIPAGEGSHHTGHASPSHSQSSSEVASPSSRGGAELLSPREAHVDLWKTQAHLIAADVIRSFPAVGNDYTNAAGSRSALPASSSPRRLSVMPKAAGATADFSSSEFGAIGTPRARLHQQLPHADLPYVFGTREAMSRGQGVLEEFLLAFSTYNRDVGYCQGLNFLAALLLRHLPRHETFWALGILMRVPVYSLRDVFRQGLPKVNETFRQVRPLPACDATWLNIVAWLPLVLCCFFFRAA